MARNDADSRAQALVEAMTIDEKIQTVAGLAGLQFFPGMPEPRPEARGGDGFVPGVRRLGIPGQQVIGAGLGVTDWFFKRPNGNSVAYPSTLAIAASFDASLAYDLGAQIGRETRAQGFNVTLGGGASLTRDPRGGRAFEYHGEDPVLTGKLVAQTLRGSQDQGVAATIKHYALNDIENGRYGIDIRIGERAMRESDLLAFEIAIRESDVASVMGSYNKVNGAYACEHPELLTGILKDEWGFKGWVMSDWGATHSTAAAANAGLDQEFFTQQFFGKPLKAAVEEGKVAPARLDDMVHRILRSLIAVGAFDRDDAVTPVDEAAGRTLARRIAEAGSVLLHNDGILPLDPATGATIAVIGFHADKGVVSGGGSSQVNPLGGSPLPRESNSPYEQAAIWAPSPPLAAIAALATAATVRFDSGADPVAAAALACDADVAIVFVGRKRNEGQDVPDLTLGEGQDALIDAVANANPNVVVVLQTGGAVLMPWLGRVRAVLEAWFPGQSGGEAIANLLFGHASPSGKLPVSFPRSEDDLPRRELPGPPLEQRSGMVDIFEPILSEVTYDEGAQIGYKWFDARGHDVLFPFGHGLSYTRFEHDALAAELGDAPHATFRLRNTGTRTGTEIAQVYVTLPRGTDELPHRLAGWARAALEPGEERACEATLEPRALAIWDVTRRRWVMPAGEYEIALGASSRDIRARVTVVLEEERAFTG